MTGVKKKPRVRLPQGTLVGRQGDGVQAFCGVPYALPPVQGLRWQPPVPVAVSDEIIDAESFGPMAPQLSETGRPLAETSEDCLNLNIWKPDQARGAPVMVWIHGGGFCSGSNRVRGSVFANSGVVLVAPNYRLGMLGFAAHPLIESSEVNFGLLDLILALQWVRNHIDAFGGDPENVTIFGVSAGGQAVNLLMTMPQGAGLFHKAISQSGYGTWPLLRLKAQDQDPRDILGEEPETAEDNTSGVLRRIDATELSSASLLRLPADTIVQGQYGFQRPIIDGLRVLEEPGRCLAQGVGCSIPYVAGANSFDGSVMPSYQLNPEDYGAVWDEWDPSWRMLYDVDLVTAPEIGIQRLFGDERYLLSAWVLSEAMARLGAPAYRYYLDLPGPEGLPLSGSPHGFDGFLLFESKVFSPGSDWEVWGGQLRRAWIEFARAGVPCALDPRVGVWQPVGESSQWHRLGSASGISDQLLNERLSRLLRRYHYRCHGDPSPLSTS